MKLSFIAMAMVCCACNTRPGDRNGPTLNAGKVYKAAAYLKPLVDTYGDGALEGLFFTDSSYQKTASSILAITGAYTDCGLEGKMSGASAAKRDSLAVAAEQYVAALPASRRDALLHKTAAWANNDILLMSVLDGHLEEGVYFEEIVSMMPALKPILLKYIDPRVQDWRSIEGTQSCHLYVDVQRYVAGLPEPERQLFFRDYFAAASKIAIADVKQKKVG